MPGTPDEARTSAHCAEGLLRMPSEGDVVIEGQFPDATTACNGAFVVETPVVFHVDVDFRSPPWRCRAHQTKRAPEFIVLRDF